MRVLLAALLFTTGTARAQTAPEAPRPRNVVFMIADGFGPASETLAREAHGRPLALDGILTGSVSTAATDSRVTDSAAGATAYACGIKTYNGAIAVGPDRTPCVTVLEAARDAGFATGLVATSRITHATPAAYAAHVPQRADEAEIAAQMAEARLDVMIGGGGRFFVPESAGGSRTDGRDLRRDLLARGALVTTTRAGLDRFPAAPAVALLAPDHMAYEIDRDETDEPALAAMAVRALDLLAATPAARTTGFFLMIEGSRIDHAGHANDAGAHVRDILAYDAAVAAVLAWARRDGNTLVVSTADHETGGLTLGRDGIYAYDPAGLMAATMSAERLKARLDALPATDGGTWPDAPALLRDALGPSDLAPSFELNPALLVGPISDTTLGELGVRLFGETLDRRAGVAWTTVGHTGVDVGLYAVGPGADLFRGAMPNDAVGRATFAALGLPLPPAAQAAADAASATPD